MNSWPLPALITTDVRSRNIATNELIATFARCDIRRIPMLFRYPDESVGVWLELHENLRGHYARGRLISDVMRPRELVSLVRASAIDGLSVGFRPAKYRIYPRTCIRHLHAVDLWEISILFTFPLRACAR